MVAAVETPQRDAAASPGDSWSVVTPEAGAAAAAAAQYAGWDAPQVEAQHAGWDAPQFDARTSGRRDTSRNWSPRRWDASSPPQAQQAWGADPWQQQQPQYRWEDGWQHGRPLGSTSWGPAWSPDAAAGIQWSERAQTWQATEWSHNMWPGNWGSWGA